MNKLHNCLGSYSDCPYLQRPKYKAGFTGKSGTETWYWCRYHRDFVRFLKSCELAGLPTVQKQTYEQDVKNGNEMG